MARFAPLSATSPQMTGAPSDVWTFFLILGIHQATSVSSADQSWGLSVDQTSLDDLSHYLAFTR